LLRTHEEKIMTDYANVALLGGADAAARLHDIELQRSVRRETAVSAGNGRGFDQMYYRGATRDYVETGRRPVWIDGKIVYV
jgi:hypothetical protein